MNDVTQGQLTMGGGREAFAAERDEMAPNELAHSAGEDIGGHMTPPGAMSPEAISPGMYEMPTEEFERHGFKDPFNRAERLQRKAKVLESVWLYDEEPEARQMVDSDGEFAVYAAPVLRKNDDALRVYGRDYARVASPELADMPLTLADMTIESVRDETRRKLYRDEFDELAASGKDTADSYYALYGKMVRDEVRERWKELREQNRVLQEKYTQLLPKMKRAAMGDAHAWTPDEAETLAMAGVGMETIDRLGNAGQLLSQLAGSFEIQDSDALAIMDAVGLMKPRKEWSRDDELVYNVVLQAYGEVKKRHIFREWEYDAHGNDLLRVTRKAEPGLDTLKANVELMEHAYRPLEKGEGFADRAREIFQTNLKISAQMIRPVAQAGRTGGRAFARMVLPVRNVDDEQFKAYARDGASLDELRELTHLFRNDLAAADRAAADGTLEKMSWAQNAGVMFGNFYAQTVPWLVGGGVGALAKGVALGRAAIAGRAAGLAMRTTEAAAAATGARAATLAARGEFLAGVSRHERLFRWGGKLAPKAGQIGLGGVPTYNTAQVDFEVEGQALGLSPEENAVYSRLHAFSGTASELIGLHALTKVPWLKKGVDWLTRRGGRQSGLLRSAYNRSTVAQTLIYGGGVVMEEGFAEPVVEGLMNYMGNGLLTDERAHTHLNGEWVRQIVAGIDPTTGQGAALLFFSAIGTAPHVQSFGATARAYTKSLANWKALGGTEAGWREAATIAKLEDRDTFTRRHLTSQWKKNPEHVAEQLKALNEEYRKTEFVSELVGMTSYKILQEQGLIDPTTDNADGSMTVFLKEEGKEERTPVTMSPEAYEVYVASRVSKNIRQTVVEVQDLLNAEQSGDAIHEQGAMEVVDMPGPLTARTAQSLGRQIKSLIAKLEAEGLTAVEARDTVDVGISNTLSLGEMLGVVEGFEERVKLAKGRGELDEEDAGVSYAFVVRKNAPVGDAMRLVLLRAKGLATNSQMFEEAMEQGALARMRELNGGEEVTPEMVRSYGEALQQLQREFNERDGGKGTQFIDVKKEAPELRDVVEAFSLMGRSHLLREMMAGRSSLPEHVQAPFLYAARYMDRFADQVKLADALADALKRDASGQIQGMLDTMQGAIDAVYESPAAREPFEIEEARKRFEAMKEAWKKAEEWEQAALAEVGQIEEPGEAQGRQPGTGEAHFSLAIPAADVCRTRQEARAKVGRQGEPLKLENRFLKLEAVFNAKSEGKFGHEDSRGRTEQYLTVEGYSKRAANTAHWTAFGNVSELFANAERMKFERAYKKKDSRKGFLHVYSPFEMEGFAGEFEADIELMLHQKEGQLPTAYLLNVTIQKRPTIYSRNINSSRRSGAEASADSSTSSVTDIQSDFPEIVKPQARPGTGEAHFSLAIPSADICRTRQEARAKVGRQGEPLKLENRFLELEAVFNAKSEGKFAHDHSLGRTISTLVKEGYGEEDAKTAHWTAYGNVKALFANGERIKFERAYKKKDVRKGFLHVFSPFVLEGIKGDFEADIELEIHQEAGKLPTSYLLNVSIQKRPQAVVRSVNETSIDSAVPETKAIQSDFPEFVKPQARPGTGEAHFSLAIPAADVCRTRQEARAKVGRVGNPIPLENRYLQLEAELSAKSERKFSHDDSIGRTFAALRDSGLSDDEIKAAHFSAYGNVVKLFANAERMRFERAYKKKEERKGFLHVYSPFAIEGGNRQYEADIELMIYQQSGQKPTAYLLNVSIQEKLRAIETGVAPKEPSHLAVPAASAIQSDFPEIVKPQARPGTGEAHFSLAIPSADICRTRQEARAKVGRQGEPLKLENRFLELEAVFNALSEGKFSHQDSLGRSINVLTAGGYTEEDAKTAHWTAYGNVKELFANGERMKFERAYKKKDSRKGFLHVYSPFEIEGMEGDFDADIELMIHQEAGKLPTAYLLSVSIQKRHQAVLKSMNETSIDSDVPDANAIQSDFPEFVKPQARFGTGEAHFSLAGGKPRFIAEDDNVGLGAHLGEEVEPVELHFDRVARKGKDWIADTIEFYLAELAGKSIPIGATGYTLHVKASRSRAKLGAKGVNTQQRHEAFRKLDEVFKKAYRIGSFAAENKEGQSKARENRVAHSATFERFGYPARVNGRPCVIWFTGQTRQEGDKDVLFAEFGVAGSQEEGGNSPLAVSSTDGGKLPPSSLTLGEALEEVNGKIKGMPRIVRSGGGAGTDAQFSIIGEHAATWDKHRSRAFTGRADGRARAELDASQAELLEEGVRAAREEAVPLGKFIDFPELFAAYPQLADLPVRFSEALGREAAGSLSMSPDSGGQVIVLNAALKPEAVLPELLHEVQHAIQGIEGFSPGGTLLDAYAVYAQRLNEMIDRFNNGNKSGDVPRLSGNVVQASVELNELLAALADRTHEDAAALRSEVAAVGSRLMEIYRNMPGEVEARRVAERLRMKAAERRAQPFEQAAPEISFSISPTLRTDLTAAYENRTKNDAVIPLCTCPPVFRVLGLPESDIVTQAHIVRKLRGKHGLTVQQIVEAVRRLDDPLFIVRESSEVVILLPGRQAVNRLGEKGDMIAPVKLERTKDGLHFMASLYAMDSLAKIDSLLRQGNLLYSKYSKEALESTSNAPELSPDLMRLMVNQGFHEHTITKADFVNGKEMYGWADTSFSVSALGPDGKVLTPETFITKPDGNPDWFVLPARKGQAAMPVRLLVGEDTDFHRGYGLTHIAASRNEEGLWATMSPAKYLANILSEVSELWEVVPGREILVRGKRPSSWMVLQLDKAEGYYSIVTAYTTRPGQQPRGKKLPLVERTIDQNGQKDTRQTHLSTNPDAEPGAFGALKNRAASSGSFAGGEGAPSLPQGAPVVNINEVQLRFDDGGMMPASFSVSALGPDGKVLTPETFITKPDGNPDWFVLPARKGQAAMPVRLLVGADRGTHKGYGLTHIAASRDLEGLWQSVSPEKYLTGILSNVSELWEVVPGREILVKGKRPASWMVLQLIESDGYYSIISAHPISGNRKPTGKKLPLAERVADRSRTRVDRSQRPANPDAVPGAFSGSHELSTATQATTAGGEVTTSLPQGAPVVNINEVQLRFDDGGMMPASFSVSALGPDGKVLTPETFITKPDGNPDWFVLPARKGQAAMPVRLLAGQDKGAHSGYGLTHIAASRDLEGLWKRTSPARYLADILANVGELWEVVPGREILVKGKAPSSWMVLQLDRAEGYYSIISAYPVEQGKKPKGKKLPLAERASGIDQMDARHRQPPANAKSGTARLGPGSASETALPSQSAGGEDAPSLPQGAPVVNINEVQLRFDDGGMMPASFSVSALGPDGKVLTPETFITKPDGNPDWFVLPARKGQAAMPVRLLVGADRGTHKGYGLTHIAASRDLEGLWQSVSPEKYLTGILSNVSELWEVVPGREILVKGKRPASWMVLQLIESDGYYSIISALPVEGTLKKPKGRKIPFDGRFSSTPGKEATGVFGSKDKNPSGGLPSKGSALDKASQEAMTADRGYVSSLPQGAPVVNINEVQLRFDDGGMMPASFSVAALGPDGKVLTPETFITKPDGNPDWFVLPARKGQAAMPVRLLAGQDKGAHSGYGLTHIAASRDLEGLWKRTSPARYLADILANVSELWEVVPGREILVKGKAPSSWMVLQLDSAEGYYSIVTAYPMRGSKKPLGKKLPLAERSVAQGQQPANAKSGTARLGPGSASETALPSQSAGEEVTPSLPQGAPVVNINEVQLRFDDGGMMPASFSLQKGGESLDAVTAAWRDSLARYERGEFASRREKNLDLRVGPTPTVLRMLGAKNADLVMTPGVLDKVTREAHAIPLDELKKLPEALHDPLAVFESATSSNSLVVLTELREGRDNVVVAVHLTSESGRVGVSRITSLYGKNNPRALWRLPLLYFNNKKARGWLTAHRLQLPGAVPSTRGHKGKILTPADLVKWKEKNGWEQTAFSIQDAGDLLGILSRLQAAAEGIDLQGDALYDAPIVRMRAAVTRQIERLSRTEDFGESGSALSELASAYVLLDEVERALPGNGGFGLEAYKTWTQFFIRLMKSGRIDEAAAALPMSGWPEVMRASFGRQVEDYLAAHPEATAAGFLREYGEKRLMRLVGKFMERARGQLDRYRKDVELGRLRRVVAAVAPRYDAQGKPLRSKMAADDYRELVRLMRLVKMTSGQYDEAVEAWEKKKDANGYERDFNEARDEEEMLVDVYDASGKRVAVPCTVREFRALGSWERMGVGEAMAARSVIGELIATGRLSWDAALERRRSMLSDQAERLDAAFSNLTESEKKELLKAFRNERSELNVFAPMECLAQFLDVLRVVPGFGDIADGWARRLDAAIVAIRDGERERHEFLAAAIEKATGFKEGNQQLDWLEKMRQSRDTGVDVTEQAPDFESAARERYRKRVIALLLRKKRSKGEKAAGDAARKLKGLDTGLADELRALFPDVDGYDEYALDEVLTGQELARYGDAGKYIDELAARSRAKSKKRSVGSEYVPRKQRLSLSAAAAANLVLLGEQEDYREYFLEKGYTEEVFEELRAFAGKEMMGVAYAMREYMGRNGEAVKALVESRYGVPFALTDNYWRAYFDVQGEVREEEIAQGCGFGNAQGTGTFGSIHARRRHRANLDLTMDAFTVFNTAMGEQDALLNLSVLHHDMVGFMNFKDEVRHIDVGNSLLRVLSVGDKERLTEWTKAVARAGTERVRGLMELDQCAVLLQSSMARAVLAGRFGTLAKQTTAILNTLYGSELVTGREYARSFGRVLAGQGVMPLSEMAKEPELRGRGNASYAELADVLRLAEDRKRERGGWLDWVGMNALDRVDVGFNVVSACVIYDAVYRRLQSEAPDMDAGALHAAAMAEVREAHNVKGQAQTVFNKPMLAQTKHPLSLMTLFLNGETFGAFGAMARMARRGRTLGGFRTSEGRREYAKIVPMWLLNGAILSTMQALIDDLQDDEKRRKKRTVEEYLLAVPLGPLQGIPGVDALVDWAFSYGHYSSSVSPISIGDRVHRFRKLSTKNAGWHDYVLATNDLVRGMAVGLVYYSLRHRSTSQASMAVAGSALSAAAVSHALDFLIKTERAA